MDQKPKIHPAVAAIIVIVLVGIVASAAIVVANNNANDSSTETTQPRNDSSEAQVDTTDVSEYRDGTYAATGTYLSPGGRESVELTVTIKDGAITETSLTTNASDAEAKEYQGKFAENYKTLVVGRKVNGLSLSRVAGSSLTSNGFNDALDEIRSEARA